MQCQALEQNWLGLSWELCLPLLVDTVWQASVPELMQLASSSLSSVGQVVSWQWELKCWEAFDPVDAWGPCILGLFPHPIPLILVQCAELNYSPSVEQIHE